MSEQTYGSVAIARKCSCLETKVGEYTRNICHPTHPPSLPPSPPVALAPIPAPKRSGLSQHVRVQPLPADLDGLVCRRPLPGISVPQRADVGRPSVGVQQRRRRPGPAEAFFRLRPEHRRARVSLHGRGLPGLGSQGASAFTRRVCFCILRRFEREDGGDIDDVCVSLGGRCGSRPETNSTT